MQAQLRIVHMQAQTRIAHVQAQTHIAQMQAYITNLNEDLNKDTLRYGGFYFRGLNKRYCI